MAQKVADSIKAEDADDEVPPPPYTPGVNAPLPLLPRQQLPQQQVAPPVRRQFPSSFNMYKASWGQRHYEIGERQGQTLYAVSLHSGWSGQPDIVLHSGPSNDALPLATVDGEPFSRVATVVLPARPHSGRSAVETRLEPSGSGLGPTAMLFSVLTGPDASPNQRRESFEWRHSHAPEVTALGGRSSGWKLVRLATDAPGGGGGGGGSFVKGGPTSRTDGREVVAVWAWPSMSMSKAFKFRFLGSGATGALGERWAVAAVATALRIWDRERKARNSSAASGGGGGA